MSTGAPVFTTPPVNHRVIKGQGLQLSCVVEGDPLPKIEWFLDRIPLDDGPKYLQGTGKKTGKVKHPQTSLCLPL